MKKTIIVLLVLFQFTIFAQRPPEHPSAIGLLYKTYSLHKSPELTLDMPYDIMIAKIRVDSILKTLNVGQYREWLTNCNTNPEIKKYFRDLYNIADYNPIAYIRLLHNSERLTTWPEDDLFYELKKYDPNYLIKTHIILSHYIYQVRIDSTTGRSFYEDDPKMWWQEIVKSTIIDTIKGEISPSCKSIDTSDDFIETDPSEKTSQIGSCFQFEYEPGFDSSMDRFTGKNLLHKGEEYIVFLKNNVIFPGSVNDYYSVEPFSPFFIDYRLPLFKIVNGKVIDSLDTFGFGDSLDVNKGKRKLREEINKIKNPNLSRIAFDNHKPKNDILIFPNPLYLSSDINLTFSLQTNSKIKIDLINSLGIKVGNSYLDYFDAGTHTIRYTPERNLPNGTYWLRMTINNKEQIVKPVVILK